MAKAAKKPKQNPVKPAELMLREAGGLMLSTGQCSRLRLAMRLENGSGSEQREADRIVSAINVEVRSGLKETIRLEVARGGTAEQTPLGPVRLKNRDGLHSLLEAREGLTVAQYDAGMAYREGHELRSADVGSQMGAGEGGAGHDNDRYVYVRLTRAKKLTRTASIDRLVALECRDEPACLQMLRWVAGEGHSLSAFGEGRSFQRHLKALKRALDVAAGHS